MITTITPTHKFVTTEPWYFYASTTCEYICRLDPDGNIPIHFYGPYESKDEAAQEYLAWKLEHMESDEDESD